MAGIPGLAAKMVAGTSNSEIGGNCGYLHLRIRTCVLHKCLNVRGRLRMGNILQEYQTIPHITRLLNGLFGLHKIERDAVMQVEWIQWLGTKKSQEMQDVQQAPDIAAFNPCHLIAHGAGCCPE